MRPLTKLCLSIAVFAVALPVALAALVARAIDEPAPPASTPMTIRCDTGGAPVSPLDYLLANVTITDRLARNGDLRNRPVTQELLEQAAADFAAAQTSPATTLGLLSQCLSEAHVRYPVGYAIIARALYREAQRRPGS